MKKKQPAYSAFISYASDDREKADEICASLEERGFVCWIAPRDIRSGREYGDEIITGIERSACVVLVLSEAANTSVFVRREVERAVSKHKPIFPVRISEVVPSAALELFVSGTHWLDAWDGDWDGHMTRLAREVSSVPAGKPSSEISTGRLSLADDRGLRGLYLAVAIVLGAAVLAGAGYLVIAGRSSTTTAPPAVAEQPVPPAPTTPPVSTTPPVLTTPPAIDPTPARVDNPTPPPRRVEVAAPAVAPSRELVELRDALDELSSSAEAVDATLNRLWEDMKPLSPRVDMATRQRSLATSLARSREALTEKNADAARRYMENARADLAALQQFLGR